MRAKPVKRTDPPSSRAAKRSSLVLQTPAKAWVECVAQTVAQQIDRQYGHRQEHTGEQDDPSSDLKEAAALGHHVAPARNVGRCARAQEGQARLGQYCCSS